MSKMYHLILFLCIALCSNYPLSAQITACDSLIGTGASKNNLPNGTYVVEVTDANGCTRTREAYVNTTYNFTISTNVLQNNYCTNSNQGQASVTVNGTGPFTYQWSSGSTSATASNLASGTHTVTVTNASGCQQTASAYINRYSLNVDVISPVYNNCTGPNQGVVNASLTNGTPPYSYIWNTGSTQSSLNNMPNGAYYVTVTDANNCAGTASDFISSINDLSINVVMLDQNTCTSTNLGSVYVYASGTAPFTFLWNTGSTAQQVYNLANGTYTVTVTNANGCTKVSSVNLVPESDIVFAVVEDQTNNCTSHNQGAVSIVGIAGDPYSSYQWSNGGNNWFLTGLDNGTYTVTVSNANGCTASEYITINADNPLNVTTTTVQNNSCPAAQQGQVSATANGQPPYTYRWYRRLGVNPPVITANGQWLSSTPSATYQWYRNDTLIVGATAQSFYAVVPGNYTVVATNNNGCSAESDPQEVTIISGLQGLGRELASIFPNPTAGEFTISLPMLDAEIVVSDIMGRVVSRKIATSRNENLELHETGIYLISILSDQGTQVIKLVVSK